MDGNWSSRDGGDSSEVGADTMPGLGDPLPGGSGRLRRTTLDQLNAELAVLDRPLEDEVEYYDDPPPNRTWRRVGTALGAFLFLGVGALFAIARWSPPAVADEAVQSSRLVVPAAAPPPAAPSLADVAAPANVPPPDGDPELGPAAASDTPARDHASTGQAAGARHRHRHAAHASKHHHRHVAGR
jgi:hypothetical protein